MVANDLHTRFAGEIAEVRDVIEGHPASGERFDPRFAMQMLALNQGAIQVKYRGAIGEIAHVATAGTRCAGVDRNQRAPQAAVTIAQIRKIGSAAKATRMSNASVRMPKTSGEMSIDVPVAIDNRDPPALDTDPAACNPRDVVSG